MIKVGPWVEPQILWLLRFPSWSQSVMFSSHFSLRARIFLPILQIVSTYQPGNQLLAAEWYIGSYLKINSLKKYKHAAAAAAKLLQPCLTLCDPIDRSPPGSSVPGILQARTLEWGAISFSSAWKWKVKVKSLSGVQLSVTPRTAAN